jgi:hypothetical protein
VTAATTLKTYQTKVYITTGSAGNYNVTLPSPAKCPGNKVMLLVIAIGSDDAVVVDEDSNTIKAGLDAVLDCIVVESNGSEWQLIYDGVA